MELVLFGAQKDVEQTEESCTKLRNHVGQNVPLLACAGRYAYPLIKPGLGHVLQAMIILPFDADEFRETGLNSGFDPMDDQGKILKFLAYTLPWLAI